MNDLQATIADEGEEMGRVTTPAVFENLMDYRAARAGTIPSDAIRRVEVADALVDTGASTLALPPNLIAALGLVPDQRRRVRTAGGVRETTIYSEVRLSVQDRNSVVRVVELPEGSPVRIGQIPLEEMDLVVYPQARALIPNPAHDGDWNLELY